MLTLAIGTATKVCTIALCRDKEILAEYTINMGMTHSEGLLPQLDSCCSVPAYKSRILSFWLSAWDPVLLPVCVSVWQRQRLWLTAGSAVCMELIL